MAHLPILARLRLHDIVSTEGGAGPQSKSNAQIVKDGVNELLSMVRVNLDNKVEFTNPARADEIAKSVITASKEIARDDPDRDGTFAPNVSLVYVAYLGHWRTTREDYVERFLQKHLDQSSSVAKGQKRNLLQNAAPLRS